MCIKPVVFIKMAKGRTIEQKNLLIREFTRTSNR
ncbi:MAG: 4-oxalocrotonate tautomerase family protein [Methanoregulaceae archaeon]|nr:4-oxalocrotonate tautomerase family protein [Methanoregulaceae archaeon]